MKMAVVFVTALILNQFLWAAKSANDAEFSKRTYFRLSFTLAIPDGERLRFVDANPASKKPGATGRFLGFSVGSMVRLLNSTTLRFTFEKPIQVQTLQDGSISTVFHRHIDLKVTRQSLQNFDWLQSLETGTVLIEKSTEENRLQKFSEILEQDPKETFQRKLNKGQFLPNLYIFNGELSLGFVDFAKVSEQEPIPFEMNRVDLRKLTGFDPEKVILKIDGKESISGWLETVRNYARKSVQDPQIARALEVQSYVAEAWARANSLGVYTSVIDGQMTLILAPPKSNVQKLPMGSLVKSCEKVLTPIN